MVAAMREFAFLDHDGPIAMAHRGFSLDGLENSMAAFGAAVDLGLRLSGDRRPRDTRTACCWPSTTTGWTG